MKMNATKLTIALVALLLALTCVFAACGKKNNTDTPTDNTPVDNNPTTVDTVAKEDLNAIAESLKAAYVANYVDLYAPATANEIDAAKSAALINIFAATSKEEAQKVADDFIAYLKSQKTIIDSIAALVEKIGDVSLKDADALNQLADVVETLDNAYAGDNAAKKAALDAYKADAATQKTIKDIVDRYDELKAAKKAADAKDGLNAEIADMKADFTKADKEFTLNDFNSYEKLLKKIEAAAEEYNLKADTDAYADVFATVDLAAAKAALDAAFKKDTVLERMQAIVDMSKALDTAAEEARWKEYIYVDEDTLDLKDEDGTTTVPTTPYTNKVLFADGTVKYGKFAYELVDAIGATGDNKQNTAIKLPDGTVKYYNGPVDDHYAPTASGYEKTAVTGFDFTAYASEDEAKEAGVKKIAVIDAKITLDYKLSLKTALVAAIEARDALLDDYTDTTELTKKYGYAKTSEEAVSVAVANINAIETLYTASAVRAKAGSTALVTGFMTTQTNVELQKDPTPATYSLQKELDLDSTLGKFTNKKAADNQATIVKAIDAAVAAFTAQNEANGSFYKYGTYDHTGDYNAAATNYEFDLVNGTPTISYTAWTYRYQLKEKDDLLGTTKFDALKVLAATAGADSFTPGANAETARKALRWLAMYIGDGEYEESYNLYEYKDFAGFVKADVIYMTDRDITEVAVPEVVKIHGEAVNVAKDETALGAKLLSPYTVAKALVEEQKKIDDAKADAVKELSDAALALRTVGDAEAIKKVTGLRDKIVSGEYVDAKLEYGLDFFTAADAVVYDGNTYATGDEKKITYVKIALADLATKNVVVQEKPEVKQPVTDLIADADTALTKALDSFKAVEGATKAAAVAVGKDYVTLLDGSASLQALYGAVSSDKYNISVNNDYAKLFAAYVEKADEAYKIAKAGEDAKVINPDGDSFNTISKDAKTNRDRVEMIGYIFDNYGNFDDAYGTSSNFINGKTLVNNANNAFVATDFSQYADKAGSYAFDGEIATGTPAGGYLDAYWNSEKITEKEHVAIAYRLAEVANAADKTKIATINAESSKDTTYLTKDLKTAQENFDEALDAYKFAVRAEDALTATSTIKAAEDAVTDFADKYYADYLNLKVAYVIGDETYDLDLFTELYRERIMSNSQKVVDNVLTYAKELEGETSTWVDANNDTVKDPGEYTDLNNNGSCDANVYAQGTITNKLAAAAWENGVKNRVNKLTVKFDAVTSKKTGDALVKSYEFADSTYSLDYVLEQINDVLTTDITMKDLRTQAYK